MAAAAAAEPEVDGTAVRTRGRGGGRTARALARPDAGGAGVAALRASGFGDGRFGNAAAGGVRAGSRRRRGRWRRGGGVGGGVDGRGRGGTRRRRHRLRAAHGAARPPARAHGAAGLRGLGCASRDSWLTPCAARRSPSPATRPRVRSVSSHVRVRRADTQATIGRTNGMASRISAKNRISTDSSSYRAGVRRARFTCRWGLVILHGAGVTDKLHCHRTPPEQPVVKNREKGCQAVSMSGAGEIAADPSRS